MQKLLPPDKFFATKARICTYFCSLNIEATIMELVIFF